MLNKIERFTFKNVSNKTTETIKALYYKANYRYSNVSVEITDDVVKVCCLTILPEKKMMGRMIY